MLDDAQIRTFITKEGDLIHEQRTVMRDVWGEGSFLWYCSDNQVKCHSTSSFETIQSTCKTYTSDANIRNSSHSLVTKAYVSGVKRHAMM